MEQLKNQKKKIGVVIPCHNYGEYVVDAIDSAVDQDYKDDISIFVVNDGSSDDTIGRVKDMFADKDDWGTRHGAMYKGMISGKYCIGTECLNNRELFLFSLPSPTGPSNARNIGIELAFKEDCDIIAFLDADDMMVDNKISVMVEELNQLGDGAVYADYWHLYPDESYRLELKEPFDLERFLHENIGPNNTSLVTRKALETVKENDSYFDVTMRTCEDYDLFMRVAEKFPIRHVAQPLTFLRVHNDNSTNTVNKDVWIKDRQKVNEKILQRHNQSK